MDISNSEIEDFLRCRRRWNYESSNRLGLRSLSPVPHRAFHVGGVVHQVLEAQVSLGHRPNVLALVEQGEQELEDNYREVVGVGWSGVERELLGESRELIVGICNHYFNHWGEVNPLGEDFRYVHAELTFSVPIPGTPHNLRGTIDGIAQHGSGDIYLVEHKTTSMGFPEVSDLQTARQLQAYCWAARVLLDRPVHGIIYDGIAKKVPSVPKVTMKGELSRAVIATTPEIYRAAIKALELREEDYADVLAKLDGPSQFFRRHVIKFPQKSLDLFGEQLKAIVTDMANPELPLYPNRVWQGCWDCRFQELCTSEQMGEDIDTYIRLKYRREKDSTAPSRRNQAVTSLRLKED